MPAAGVVMIVAVVLIVLALVYYLVSTIVALRQIADGLDEAIAGVGEIVEKSAPVNDVVTAINEQLDAGVDLLEGLLVKKAGLQRRDRPDRRASTPGRPPPDCATSPRATSVDAPRIGEVYTRGTLTLARLGREAPIAAASPADEVLRNVEGGSLAARLLYPKLRQTARRTSRARRSSAPTPRSNTSSATTSARRASGSRFGVPDPRGASCRLRRHSSTSGRPASRARSRRCERLGAEARIIAGGHSLLPMMKLRLANPAHLIDINDLAELAYIREQDGEIRIGALTRHVDLLKSELLAERVSAVPRRRERDRRPGGAQPRHDRRLALPGGRGRGPVGRLLGGQGAGRDPRRRRRARGGDGGLPRRART